MITASASSSVSTFESLSPLATRVMEASISPPRSSSRISRPSSVSLPTMAIAFLSNPLLRGSLGGRAVSVAAAAHNAANDSGDAQGDAGGDVSGGEREQEGLAKVPDKIDSHGDGDEGYRRSGLE